MPDLLPVVASMRSFYTFRLGQRRYGIDVLQVREVVPRLAITPVPQAPAAVCGLFNLRSRIYLALDIKTLLDLAPTECTAENRLVILKQAISQDVGILVEAGNDIIHAPAGSIETAPAVAEGQSENPSFPVTGVCKYQSELFMVIDAARITGMIGKLIR